MDSVKTSESAATSPKGAGVFAKRVQRKLSRAQEKVLQKFGKTDETKDEEFSFYVQDLNDQQNDGSRIYKDLKAYYNAVKVMREASKRLSHSLFDAFESDWNGLDDLGVIVEGEDLLWNDYEAKILDQAVHTMDSYMRQFPDVKEKVAKRNRKLVDYDSSRRHLEALQNAKKQDDVKTAKAEEELQTTKDIYEDLNQELKEELPVLFGSRIGCYVTVFQAISNLRDILYKELSTMNHDFQDVLTDVKAQHPDKVFVINNLQRTASLKRRSLISPRAWRASFSELHSNISPRGSLRRKNPTSPLRSVQRPSLEVYSETEPQPTPDPQVETITEVRDVEVSSTCSEQPPAEELNEASGGGEGGEKVEKEEEKPQEDKQGEPDLTLESADPGKGGTGESPVPADNNPAEAKAEEEALMNNPDSSEILENGEASDSQNAGVNCSSSHGKGAAAAEESGLDRETVM
ncbi:bridging integrator 2a [Clupea harengus]|uniref:Bridging integrator 2a n=1 Tax=Clupea harengus TaxID=7950 RepID=A0A8M1KER4_CLUHA|nr:bridging integrator 2a [Clupea harengus]